MKLSDKITIADYHCLGLAAFLEYAGHPSDGDAIKKIEDVIEVLQECLRTVRNLESAPVAKAGYYSKPPMRAVTGITLEGPDIWPLAGKRVAIVPIEEVGE